ncbi:hypothetical protein SMACR_01401 [Sordaria macrospora]|uniref:WGS project CABT00000000 data, contig 2.4 n=2 Tax=Sordaria macrospora TaxID=5147 RepID=F7VQQ4_SORMK|nr:uncharacterized protein SMAC_01401 [Sordaria macrospora k-hell]KAA8633081.1 hypothetical protein SMACR_01401 [Sordaria macrospora]WPJ58718.1 hypothetical protein SMAC4_01401 [Sordaria macrospora]CCC07836.1 unnamed protein product [Sordaria macrospora k-hell]
MKFFALAALAAPLVSAIQFVEPAANATLHKGDTFDLKWSTVDTDPTDFSVYLVNFVNWPPYYAPLAYNVEPSSGELSVTIPCDIDSSYGWQFNAINGTNVYVIYAQTPKFFISGGPCSVDSPFPTGAPSVCAPEATVTVTVSTTLSQSSFSTLLYANSTGIASPTTLKPATITKSPLPGKCPDTIGWGPSGYDNPVTLTAIPTGPGDIPAAPTVTAPPVANGAAFSSKAGSTSTIYHTVYKDLSEVQGCVC